MNDNLKDIIEYLTLKEKQGKLKDYFLQIHVYYVRGEDDDGMPYEYNLREITFSEFIKVLYKMDLPLESLKVEFTYTKKIEIFLNAEDEPKEKRKMIYDMIFKHTKKEGFEIAEWGKWEEE